MCMLPVTKLLESEGDLHLKISQEFIQEIDYLMFEKGSKVCMIKHFYIRYDNI